MSKQLRIWLFVLLGTLLTSTTLPAEGVITLTTSQKVGGRISLKIWAKGNFSIVGAEVEWGDYVVRNQTITIRGEVTKLDCSKSSLRSLDVSSCPSLAELLCYDNQLSSLDVSKNTALTGLSCVQNQLTNLDVSKNKSLRWLYCFNNQLTSLDLTENTVLTDLDCKYNQLTSLNLANSTSLIRLACSDNKLTSLDLSDYTVLTTLECSSNPFTSINLSGCKLLKKFSWSNSDLTSLNVSGCTSLTELECYNNQLISLDVSGCTALRKLNCHNNQLTSLDLSGCIALSDITCRTNRINQEGITRLVNSLPDRNGMSRGSIYFTYRGPYGDQGELNWGKVSDVVIAKRKNWTLTKNGDEYEYEGVGDGIIYMTTALNVGERIKDGLVRKVNKEFFIEGIKGDRTLTSQTITIRGDVTELNCDNTQLTSLDVSNCPSLTTLYCYDNQLTNLNVTGCTALTWLSCYKNQLSSLPLSACISLTHLNCSDNQLTSLDVSDCRSLKTLDCRRNKIKSAEMSQLINSLPNRRGYEYGSLDVVDKSAPTEENFCYQYDMNVAGYKNWSSSYPGEPNRTCSVTKTLEGKGTLSITGAADLGVVAYGTMLTVVATPDKNYELVALTANGVDITATKKFVVKDDVIVKAVFKGNDFKVSLEQDGEGDLSVTGVDNLDEVPYGTELTIIANPKKGYELTSLIANGINITDTKKVTVRGNLTIKATFTQKTRSFVVTLTKEGEGTITATGADDLSVVDYGTELTINATPAEGYELTALTANGMDILASKKVTVQGATEVKATFTQKTRNFVVTLTKEGEGTITATGADDLNAVDYGTELTINATPAEGYELTALTANGTDILATKKVTVKEALEVKATFTKKTFAVTLDKVGEGELSTTSTDNLKKVPYGTELTVIATPAEGYELTSIVADGVNITDTKKIAITDNMTVKATFTKKNFAVSLTKEGEGTITATGASSLNAVAYGTELTINATPAEGYELTALTANGTDILASKKLIVKEAVEVKATFTKKVFAVSLTKEGEGAITATGASNLNSVAYGTELTINATPAAGYELVSITANGTDITATKKVVVTDNLTVKATFAKKSFAVSLTKEGEGTISATDATSLNAVAYGTELTINATPAEGYELTALTANGTDILATKKIVVKGNLTVKATFTKKNFAVTLSKEGEGTITATGADDLNAVAYGTELTIVATPAAGYELQSLVASGVDITTTKKIVVKGHVTVKATFTKKAFAVSLTKEGEGTISATGADDLNAVAYGTELTIVATPAEGYELQSLVAGGVDITATKKIVVKDNLTVKATFAKKSFAVSLTKEGEGTITATGASNLNSVAYGTELTINATPATGYELVSITAGSADITATKKVVVKDNLTVKATFAKKSFAVSLTKEGEGTITATGASNLNSVAYGTELTIVATPAAGYELQSLVAGGVDITATKKIVVKDNLTVKATFAKKNFAVTLTKEGEGTITATGASNLNAVAYGTELTINATPAAGYELVSITAGGTDITATKKVVVTDNLTVKATFAKKSFAVTFDKEGEGSISATGASNLNAVAYGTELTINATPAAGYELVSITAGGTDITASKKVVVTGNLTIKATFAKKSFAVTFEKEGEGTISATGASNLNSVAYGTELTINATPAEGYELTALTANGTDILATKKIVVKDNLTVKATFAKKAFAVSLTKEGEGTITATGASNLNAVAYGTELTINATPAMGYELVSITAGGTDITASKKVVVTGNLTIKATFAKKNFAVSLTKEGEGAITATGASNLNSVAYGTELTIVATPAEGYELVSITAGGTDITASKKVVVTDNLTVKATFTKKSFAVSLIKEGEGTISATGASSLNAVAYGTELTIVATPAEGYELTALTANGTDILATKKIVVKDNLIVKATFAKKNFAVSLTKEGEGTITATGASNLNSVAYGTELTINATPATGYELVSITAGGSDITATKKVVVKDNVTVKATFAKKNFAVSLTKEGEGMISATGASNLNSVAYGTELTIVATPAEGYELVSITSNGTDITAAKKIVVTDNMTVKATFAKKNFAVSLTKEGEGTITATGASNLNSVAYGTELTINATPAEGYELVSITAGGSDITASKKVVVTDNLTIKATFAKKNFSVSLTKEGEGTITATGASNLNSVAYGTELTINATPAKGYELTALTANGTDILATKKIVVKDNLTVKATFAKKSFAVSLTKEGEGTITATGASNLNSVAYGTELTIVATPAEGYELTALTANGTDILATKKIVVKDNLTVKATFAKKSFAVTLTKEGEGTISATGASNLNSVAYGTELTIVATPAEGYELTALTANGTDILTTKKVVVTGNLTVKATFAKKTFAVTLTSNEHGEITIVEPVDLKAVPYGTTLTVKATGKNAQCVLTELTANGEDILATQSFVVTGVTEVKATFVDHTGVETTVTQQVKLYPNPATDYVIVEGVAAASEVTLHSMTGERLYAGRADSRGTLQIDLTPYADGVYLVCVAGETYRVVVRH